jgi:hypothetical protein
MISPMKKLNYKKLVIGEFAALILGILAMAVFRADIVMMVVYVLIIAYLVITKQKSQLKNLVIASIMAIIWLSFGKSHYGYNTDYILIFGMNALPLFAWACGLFGSQLLYSRCKKYLPTKNLAEDLILFTLAYIVLLVIIEIIGYNALDIHNSGAAQLPGLPFCECMHIPYWMTAVYFTLGPVNYLITRWANR